MLSGQKYMSACEVQRESSLGALQALDQIFIPSEPGQDAQAPDPAAHPLQVWCYVV